MRLWLILWKLLLSDVPPIEDFKVFWLDYTYQSGALPINRWLKDLDSGGQWRVGCFFSLYKKAYFLPLKLHTLGATSCGTYPRFWRS